MRKKTTSSACARASVLLALSYGALHQASAQTAPDAGQTLQQLNPALSAPPARARSLTVVPQPDGDLPKVSLTSLLKSVRFSGNTVFDNATLATAMGPLALQTPDLAGLRGLADRVANFYRNQGYPFASASLSSQNITDGELEINVVEGRYGQVKAVSEVPGWAAQAQVFLAPLQPDQLIESAPLERASLLLGDLPGSSAWPLVRPGEQDGRGDLEVSMRREAALSGSVGLDDHGNRYTGKTRSRASLNIGSPFLLGDQIKLSGLLSTEALWLGSVDYSLALGGNGVRGNMAYSHTSYALAKEFESSQTYGTAKVTSAGLSYQALRSQQSNLTWRGSVQHKRLNDNSDTFLTRYEKSSVSVPFSLQFDHRDNVGAGGVTYGAAGWTLGRLKLDAGLIEQDLAQTSGQFSKITLDVARVQNLGLGWSAYGHMTGQYTDKNLDSSELMSLGGATGVRAYPSGEASGDRGWLAQLELRWSSGAWTPYLLFDQGRVQVNARPELLAAPSPDRTLAGAGLGLRFTSNPWRADFTLAWRTQGGVPQADTSADPKPRAWLSGEYVF